VSKEIKKETDWLGREKWSIYENGIKVGEIKQETNWLGAKKQVTYDTIGHKVSETKEEIDIFGNKKLVTYDVYERKISETKYEENWLGEQKEVIYENGIKIGELKKKESIWGTEKKKLYGVNGYDVDLTTRTRRKKITKISNSSHSPFNLDSLSTYSLVNNSSKKAFKLILIGLILVSITLLLVNPDYFKTPVLVVLVLLFAIYAFIVSLIPIIVLVTIFSPLLLIGAICFPEAFPTDQERTTALILGIIPWLIILLVYSLDITPTSATETFLKKILKLASIGLILGSLIWLFSIIYHDFPKRASVTRFEVSAYRDVNINVRTRPSLSAPILGVLALKKGKRIKILDTKGDWYKIAVRVRGKDTTGWIYKKLLASSRLNNQKRVRKLVLKPMLTKPAKIFLNPKEKLKVIIVYPYSKFKENSLYKAVYEISYMVQGRVVKQENIPVRKKRQVIEIENTNSSKVSVQIQYKEYPARGLYFDPGIRFN